MEAYEIETTYKVGQKLLFPFLRDEDDPDYAGDGYLSKDAFPEEIFAAGEDVLLPADPSTGPETGEPGYDCPYGEKDGVRYACALFRRLSEDKTKGRFFSVIRLVS